MMARHQEDHASNAIRMAPGGRPLLAFVLIMQQHGFSVNGLNTNR